MRPAFSGDDDHSRQPSRGNPTKRSFRKPVPRIISHLCHGEVYLISILASFVDAVT